MTRTLAATAAAIIAAVGLMAGTAHAETSPDPVVPDDTSSITCPTNDDIPAEAITGSAEGKDIQALCEKAIAGARTPEAAQAISYAFWALGSNLACVGEDRMGERLYDTSSLIARAYVSAGLTALGGDDWAISSRNIIAWGGVPRADWSIPTKTAKPGDIIGYKTPAKTARITDMWITKKLVITAAGICGPDGDVVRLADTRKNGDGIKRTGFYYVDPELAR